MEQGELQEEEVKQGPEDQPLEREQLPYLKTVETQKISLWTVLKDSIGKEIWRITVPVYFNEPLGVLQKCAGVTEYVSILDKAIAEKDDEMWRFALVAVHSATQYQNVERSGLSKPFNPMLGETFELVKEGEYRFIAEQVSHHPPISALHCEGDSGYIKTATFQTKTSFGMGTLGFTNIYDERVELLPYGEVFDFHPPGLTFHGLIFGTPYIEVEGTATLKDASKPMEKYATIKYYKRGWLSAGNNQYLEGEVYSNGQKVITFKGRWSQSIEMSDLRQGRDQTPVEVYRKLPYPENWHQMYAMTRHNLQLNYLPERLKQFLPPTDSRFRPDQRALENGDFELAAAEKHRLEERQRKTRKELEKQGITHKPRYFEEWRQKEKGAIEYRYNGLYFEKDRKEGDWSRLPDLFGYDQQS